MTGIALLMMTAGCKRYGGGSLGGASIPQSDLEYCYVLQYGPVSRNAAAAGTPLFAILWKSHLCGEATSNGRNLFTEIHGHPIKPSLTQKAVYALQADYSLKLIPLADGEVDNLFALIESRGGAAAMEADSLWQTKIMPNLQTLKAPFPPKTIDAGNAERK
jgi:hypothetical protein